MHARTYLEAASGGEVAEVDEVRGGEADGEAEAEPEDAAHEAHRLSSTRRRPCRRRATTPGAAATAAAWGVGNRPRARAEVAGCGCGGGVSWSLLAAGVLPPPPRKRRMNRGGGGNNWSSIVEEGLKEAVEAASWRWRRAEFYYCLGWGRRLGCSVRARRGDGGTWQAGFTRVPSRIFLF